MHKIIELQQTAINTINGGRMNNPIFNIKELLINEFIMLNHNHIQEDPFQDADREFLLNTHDDID